MSGESKHTEESAAASVVTQNKNPTLEDYGKALDILERIFYLLHDLDNPKRGSDFKSNQKEIKKLVLELYKSKLPLKKGNIATLRKEIITRGGRGSRYKSIWAIVGPKKENPFERQADGSYGIGENSLFSVNSENPEDITQNMPTEPYYGDGNDYSPGRFNAYGEAVKHIRDEVINFMEGEKHLEQDVRKYLGGRRKTRKKPKRKIKKRKTKKRKIKKRKARKRKTRKRFRNRRRKR
jgi:hypothetical protein